MKASILGCLCFVAAAALPTVVHGQQSSLPDNASPGVSDAAQLKRDADAAYRKRDFEATVRLTSQVLADTPADAVALYLRGSARVELGIAAEDAKLIREGIDDARRAIEANRAKNPNFYLPYLYGMAHLTALEGDKSHAETAVTVATKVATRPGLAIGPQSNILYQRAVAHSKLEDYASAADDFRKTLELAPNHLAASLALADVLARSGDTQAAEQAYATAIERFPDNPLVYNNRGTFYQSQKRHADAIVDFTHSLKLNPRQVETYLNRGFARLSNGDYAEAQADFSHVVETQPDHAPARSLLATSELLQNNIQDALQDYLKVIELRPSHAPARADIGFAYFFARHYDTAAQAFEQALTLAPESKYLVPWRYAALSLAGRQEAANQAYRSIAQKPADNRDWFDLLTLFFMGKLQEPDLLASIDSQNRDLRDAQLCEAYYFIGLRLQKDGQGDPARYFQRAVESRSTQLSAYRAAKIELNRSRQ